MTPRTCTVLTVLTLLKLCVAEIPDSSSEKWYAANVIADGFQPKPLAELFSTETSLTNNPITVLPTSEPNSPSTNDFNNTPGSISTETPTIVSGAPAITQYTGSILPGQQQTTAVDTNHQSTLITPGSTQTQSQSIQLEVVPPQQTVQVQNQPIPVFFHHEQPNPNNNPSSNYFLIYQQAPQTIQGFPASNQNGISTQSPFSQSTENIQPVINTFSTQQPFNPSTGYIRPFSSTTLTSTTSEGPISTVRPTTVRPTLTGDINPSVTPTNCKNSSYPHPKYPSLYPLKIRVVAPSGSITNVNINPSTTTKRPPTTRRTTTKRPRTNKPRRNTYDACIDGCKGRRDPICAVPMSSSLLDPSNLKGFPSVCHMACHNSYRKDPYEKIIDGRCGRLRTRIKTVDSDSKLKRDELNKAHYFVDSGNTVVEVQALH